jgi:hypothetical protein
MVESVAERFWRYVFKTDNCWFWIGCCDAYGYGAIRINRNTEKAHVVSFQLNGGVAPNGAHVLHRCDTPQCVRPDHLYLGGYSENAHDRGSTGKSGHNSFLTHCRHGHEFNVQNTYWHNGHRRCRVCSREVMRKRRLDGNTNFNCRNLASTT